MNVTLEFAPASGRDTSRTRPVPSWMRVALAIAIGFAAAGIATAAPSPAGPYRADWKSLETHPMPEWLVDAKFGIYAHWGVYSVPAFESEWYAKRMYDPGTRFNEHHIKTWGHPSKFGYKDFVPLFKAERYDPEEWAKFIEASGARYAGLAVVHHDGFLLWDSAVSRWNAKQMGPKRDLYGDLVTALRRRGLKTIATEHHIRTYNWYLPGTKTFGEGDTTKATEIVRQQKYDLGDPAYADLYWNSMTSTYAEFMRAWRAKLLEVIDKYRPDVLWFDGGNFQGNESEKTVLEVLAHYHNQAAAKGQQVEVLNKLPGSMKFNFPERYGILTFEEGRDRPGTVARPWIDDMKISDIGWGYVAGQKYKTGGEIVAGLIDRVARGGGLLLNLSPMADGTIPVEQKKALLEVGAWLKVNGEAIYNTRPWTTPAEGDESKLRTSDAHPKWTFTKVETTDIRFTRPKNGGAVYAMSLAWPNEGRALTIKSINERTLPGKISSITLLGHKGELKFTRGADGLRVELPALPATAAGGKPFALKIVAASR
ncbi:MAG: alpha-L-fucosidase [Opitutaceae bacterium]|nr:alpha-L-fucosidase [Opitutaceae bacterium]